MSFSDIFSNDITTPIRGGSDVIPGTPLPPHTRALWVGVGGTLVVETDTGDILTFENVSDGILLPIHAKDVQVISTCDAIVALY